MDQAKEVEEEETVSPFTVEELVKLIPLHAVKEIFGYLDVENGSRLCRVSKAWKSELLLLALFNKTNGPDIGTVAVDSDGLDEEGSDEGKSAMGEQASKHKNAAARKSDKGIVFLQGSKESSCPDYDPTKFERFLWDEHPLLEVATVKHFVVSDLVSMGMYYGFPHCTDSLYNFRSSLCQKITVLSHPISRVTFYNCIEDGSIPRNGADGLLEKVETVRFIDCIFKVFVKLFAYSPDPIYRSVKRLTKDNIKDVKGWYWFYWVKRREQVLERKSLKSFEDVVDAEVEEFIDGCFTEEDVRDLRHSVRSSTYKGFTLEWHLGKKEAALALLWPYPEEQLKWLEDSLKNLEVYAGAEKKKYFKQMFHRFQPQKDHSFGMCDEGGWNTSMGLQWEPRDGEDLSIMDCAFLARLLSLNPGVPPPPFKLTGCLIEATTAEMEELEKRKVADVRKEIGKSLIELPF